MKRPVHLRVAKLWDPTPGEVLRRAQATTESVGAEYRGEVDMVSELERENTELRQQLSTAQARLANARALCMDVYDGAEPRHHLMSVLGDVIHMLDGELPV